MGYAAAMVHGWGQSADTPVVGDFDGDGKTDPTVYRPSTGGWFALKSSSNFTTPLVLGWGQAGDLPAVGDYDGDGKTDITVYRPSTQVWFVLKSGGNFGTVDVTPWGQAATDQPLSAIR